MSPVSSSTLPRSNDAAAAVSASTMYWAYDKSDGYGLLDPAGNEKPVLLGVVVRPYPERVRRRADVVRVRCRHVEVSRSTTLPDRSITRSPDAPSRFPDRVYPTAYQVRLRRLPVFTASRTSSSSTRPEPARLRVTSLERAVRERRVRDRALELLDLGFVLLVKYV